MGRAFDQGLEGGVVLCLCEFGLSVDGRSSGSAWPVKKIREIRPPPTQFAQQFVSERDGYGGCL